jgi:hypothetical protein
MSTTRRMVDLLSYDRSFGEVLYTASHCAQLSNDRRAFADKPRRRFDLAP